MGNGTTNIGNGRDDDGEVYVTIDRRGVILDLPETAGVSSLRLTRGYSETVAAAPQARPPAKQAPIPPLPMPAPFWLRWPFRARSRADQ